MKVDLKGAKYSFNHKENLNRKHKNSFTYQKLDDDVDDDDYEYDDDGDDVLSSCLLWCFCEWLTSISDFSEHQYQDQLTMTPWPTS